LFCWSGKLFRKEVPVMAEKLTSKQLLNQLQVKHYADAYAAKQRGELVGWAASIFPQEFCETMGLTVVYPENHAAAIAAKKRATPLLEQVESEGYDVDLCSYARLNLAYMKSQAADIPIPLPDFILCCNNICTTILKWYENIATELNIPMILIDVPFNYGNEPTPEAIAYIKAEFEECICQLEALTGRKFDYDRFAEVIRISNESSRAWKRAMDLGQTVPAPLNGFEIFNYMALAVCMRGRPETAEVFNLLAAELEEKIARGESCYPDGEKYRVVWDGIACWPYLGQNYRAFRDKGINIVASTYPEAWVLLYEPGNLDEMARVYTMIGNNTCMEYQADRREKLIRDFHVEGVLFHVNRSCKVMDFMQYEQQRLLNSRTGVPIATFDGDQSDPRNFSPAQFETRLQALTEMIDQARSAKLDQGGEA
jgi:benzoyl-CoA reductase/2-hydroxyglutaryl-CoA dehydratase subunit BcrC/BadD/HgdB